MTARTLVLAAFVPFALASAAHAQSGAVQGTTDATAAASALVQEERTLICTAGDATLAVAFEAGGCTVNGAAGTVDADTVCEVEAGTVTVADDDTFTYVTTDGASVSGACTAG